MDLLACSQDGSVAYVHFEEDELGERVSRADQERIWRDTYGGSASGSTAIVAESVAQLRLEKGVCLSLSVCVCLYSSSLGVSTTVCGRFYVSVLRKQVT